MKKLWLICLALMIMLALVACDDNTTPTDTTGETSTTLEETQITQETLAETQAETTPPETIPAETLDGAYILDKVLASENDFIPQEADYALDMDIVMDMVTHTNGMNATVSVSMGMEYIIDTDSGIQLLVQIPGGEKTRLIYVGDKLYVDMGEEKYVSPITNQDFSILISEILANSGMDMNIGGENNGMSSNDGMALLESMLAMIKPSALFGDAVATMEKDETYLVTAMGISEQAKKIFDTIIAQNGSDDSDVSDVNSSMLEEFFSLSEMVFTFVADKNYVLQSVSATFPMDMSTLMGYDAGEEMMANVTIKFSIDRSTQTVTVPEKATDYEELDWHWIFDMPTAEMLQLVPNENNQIALAVDDLPLFDYQQDYILNHPEEFADVTFTWTALFEEVATLPLSDYVEDAPEGVVFSVLTAYAVQGVDGEDWLSTAYIFVQEDKVAELTFEAETSVTMTFKLCTNETPTYLAELGIFFELISCTASNVQS